MRKYTFMKPQRCYLIGLILFATMLAHGAQEYDIVVYGGTPAGITAAIAASREGSSVVLLEQTRHIGGLSTSGLNRDEGEHMDRSTLGGLCDRFTFEAATSSGNKTGNSTKGARIWQSHIAEQLFLEMLEEAGVPVIYEQLLKNVKKKGSRITQLQVRGGTVYKAKVFIDATYEGDLMAAAGVSYTVGREARDTYNESKAGVRYMDEEVKVSPYDENGKLLFGVMPGKPPKEFSASEYPICYNVRMNLTTDIQNMVPIERPANYDPKQHELLARCIQAGYIKNIVQIIGLYEIPGSRKRECNNRQFSYVSMSIPGAQRDWAEASFEEREKIHQQYRDYTHGMLWFLKSDERVPEDMRIDMATYGFCKDEWQDNNHWPWYLYTRAARRMKGPYILTLSDVTEKRKKKDVIHIGSHYIDSHHVSRYAADKDHFINEGRMWQEGMRFDIPYRAITPSADECENLLVPVCVSASNVAFAAIRLEPTWMHLGEVSGMAATLAISKNANVQDIDIQELQAKIAKAGIPLEWSAADKNTEDKPGLYVENGILMKDNQAYYGIGANYFNLFYRSIKDVSDTSHITGLTRLADAGIPFVRFTAGAFWANGWKLYQEDKETYFELFDNLVELAEELEIGLIPSLFWHFQAIADLNEEHMDQFMNDNSKTIGFIKQYTSELVQRYKDSPAIWAWEFGNEFSLFIDIPPLGGVIPKVVPSLGTPAKRDSVRDVLVSACMYNAYDEFAKTVRAYDQGRAIFTGGTEPRAWAFNNAGGNPWKKDSEDQTRSMLLRYNPDPINTLTIRGYWNLKNSFDNIAVDEYTPANIHANEVMGLSFAEYLPYAMKWSEEIGKPLFVGEWGAGQYWLKEGKTWNTVDVKEAFTERLNAIVENKVPLSAFWVYDHSGQKGSWNITFDNERAYMIDLVLEANKKLKKK